MPVMVRLTAAAKKDIDGLPALVQARIEPAITRLSDFPLASNVKALTSKHKGTYRLRVGDYRVLFAVSGSVLTVTGVVKRDERTY